MTIATRVQYESLENLYLDPMNPRLAIHLRDPKTRQENLLEQMRAFKLEELACSYLESGGFWPHEALVTTNENLYSKERLIVLEGNRRLAALKFLHRAHNGEDVSPKWRELARNATVSNDLFERVPCLKADSRADVASLLGFRHITGTQQWATSEQADFIERLVSQRGWTYQQVARIIGRTTTTVRRMYIANNVLTQLSNHVEEFDDTTVAQRFTIFFLVLGTSGAQQYLNIDMTTDPEHARQPVPGNRLANLNHFYRWLFGTESSKPIVTDKRWVDDFGKILPNEGAVRYLERNSAADFDHAFWMAGGLEEKAIEVINESWRNVENVLMRAHTMKTSLGLKDATRRLGEDAEQLVAVMFPKVKDRSPQ